jgi:hypothetical protein
MAAKTLPDATYLRECLNYNPETGVLTWRHRPREHFKSEHVWRVWTSNFAGKTAGSRSDRYVRVILTGWHHAYAHRIIWKMQTGIDPLHQIDHINLDKLDNRWGNLRQATHYDNMRNRPGWSGRDLPKGVVRYKKRFLASMTIPGRGTVCLGSFKTPEEAHACYCAAAQERDGEFFNSGMVREDALHSGEP